MSNIISRLLARINQDAIEYVARKKLKFPGETATSVDDIYGKWWNPTGASYFQNPDLLSAKKGGLELYKKMREDDQVKSALHLKKSAIVQPGYDITGNDQKLVDYVKAIFADMQGSFDDTVRSILSAYDYGFSLHEKCYRYIDQGPFKGKVGIESLRQKSPTRIRFDVNEYGRLRGKGIIQKQSDGKEKRLDQDKFILFSYQKEFDNYYGESDLKAAYRFWFLKINFFRYWGMYLEKFAIPIVIGKVTGGITTEDQAKFRTIISNIQAGMAVLSPDNLEIEFKETIRSGGNTFQSAINACDIRIARAVLVPTLLGLSAAGEEGSYARASVEESTFDLVLSGDSRQISECVNEQLIRPMIDMNFGRQANYPRFDFRQMRDDDRRIFATAWADAVSKGSVTSTPETEEHMRYLLGFPKSTDEEKGKMEEAQKSNEDPAAPAGENDKNKGNGLDKKLYVLTTMSPQEARKAWKEHVEDLDGLEDEVKLALSDAFGKGIEAFAVDAKKKSAISNE